MDARIKVMAEKGSARDYSGKILAKMREDGHARRGIRREIKKLEAIREHDIVEEIRERGTEAAIEVIGKEVIFASATPGRSWTHAGCRVSFRLPCPHGPISLLQCVRIKHRGEDDVLLPHFRQLALRDNGFRLFALACLGRHGG